MSCGALFVAARLALAVLGGVAARRRASILPVSIALFAFVGADAVLVLGVPAPVERTIWLAWPVGSAALSWRVWEGRRWRVLLVGWIGLALLAGLGGRALGDAAFLDLLQAALVAGPTVSVVAWATRTKEKGRASRHSHAPPGTANPSCGGAAHATRPAADEQAPPHRDRAAQAVAAILAWSGLVDVTVGAASVWGLPWWLARAASGTTIALVAIVLLWDLRSCPTPARNAS